MKMSSKSELLTDRQTKNSGENITSLVEVNIFVLTEVCLQSEDYDNVKGTFEINVIKTHLNDKSSSKYCILH